MEWSTHAYGHRHLCLTKDHVRVSQDALERAVRSGHVTRLLRGVFIRTDAVGDSPADRHLQVALAYQLLHPDAVASHGTAAIAHKLPLLDERDVTSGAPSFTLIPGHGRRSSRHPPIWLRELPRHHVVMTPAGLRVTSPARTAVDLAARMGVPDSLVALDAVARGVAQELNAELRPGGGQLDRRWLQACRKPLEDAAQVLTRRKEVERVGAAILATDPRRESPLESIGGGLLHTSLLPAPTPQLRIDTDAGTFYADLGWPRFGLIIEFDGMSKYQSVQDLRAEKYRETALRRAGWRVERFLWRDVVGDPEGFVNAVAELLRGQGWR